MRSAAAALLAAALMLVSSCGGDSKAPGAKQAEAPKKRAAPKPTDESRRFPRANQVETKLVDDELLGKPFMPGGTLAHYRKGKTEYDLFLAKTSSPTDAAVTLSDWREALKNPSLVASFGGYFGADESGAPVFVFTKGPWIAGVKGLPKEEADLQARTFAALIPAQ